MGSAGCSGLKRYATLGLESILSKKKNGTLLTTGTEVPSLFFFLLDCALPPYRGGATADGAQCFSPGHGEYLTVHASLSSCLKPQVAPPSASLNGGLLPPEVPFRLYPDKAGGY